MKMTPEEYVQTQKAKNASLISDETTLKPIIEKVIADNPAIVAQYKAGKTGVLGFFVGAVIKATTGMADPKAVNKILTKILA